jgi:hypothetical protein
MLLWVVEYGHPGSICVALVGTMSVSEIVSLARLLKRAIGEAETAMQGCSVFRVEWTAIRRSIPLDVKGVGRVRIAKDGMKGTIPTSLARFRVFSWASCSFWGRAFLLRTY